MKAIVWFLALALIALGLALPAAAQTPEPPLRPAPPEVMQSAPEGPAEVKIGLYINDIQAIDLHNYSFVADVYVWFRDNDPRRTTMYRPPPMKRHSPSRTALNTRSSATRARSQPSSRSAPSLSTVTRSRSTSRTGSGTPTGSPMSSTRWQ
jgi:hypothetical protein